METATVEPHLPLRLVRKAAGLTQEALALAIGKTQAMISSVEKGRARLGTATVLRIADIPAIREAMLKHGVTVEDLLRGERL